LEPPEEEALYAVTGVAEGRLWK